MIMMHHMNRASQGDQNSGCFLGMIALMCLLALPFVLVDSLFTGSYSVDTPLVSKQQVQRTSGKSGRSQHTYVANNLCVFFEDKLRCTDVNSQTYNAVSVGDIVHVRYTKSGFTRMGLISTGGIFFSVQLPDSGASPSGQNTSIRPLFSLLN